MVDDAQVARAIAYFQTTDDMATLRWALEQIRPRAAREARRFAGNDRAPMPALIEPAAEPAERAEALRTLNEVKDFARLQTLARAVGQRLEELRRQNATGD